MAKNMVHELVELVSASKIRGLKYQVEVTPDGFVSLLTDNKGRRGSAMQGTHRMLLSEHNDPDSLNSLEGQARALILQEAARSLRAAAD